MKSIYKFFAIAILLSSASFLQAQVEKKKTFSGEFSDLSHLVINHRRGPLEVRKSTDGKTRYEATLFIQAKEEESAAMMLERFELKEDTFDGKLEVSSSFNIQNWTTINGKTKIKFNDGTKISGIREVKIDMIIYVGKLDKLHLKNKYDEIKIHDDIAADLSIELHSGKLQMVDFMGDLALEMKYSKGFLKNIADATMEIYDCDMVMGNAGKIQIESKYSSFKIGDLTELRGETYDDEFEMGNLTTVILEDKYSQFQMGNFKTAKLDFHDAEFKAGNAESIEIKSKYSEFVFENAGAIEFETSFDDNVKAVQVGTFSADSKYSEFIFKTVTESAIIAPSFDDKLEISSLGSSFKTLKIDGKYTDMDVDIVAGSLFHLNVDMTYGKVYFNEDSFETQVWKEKDSSRQEIIGKTKGATEESGTIEVLGFDNTVYLATVKK
jgi:hypothetical protein